MSLVPGVAVRPSVRCDGLPGALLIDGRSGAGKTRLARELAARYGGTAESGPVAQMLRVEDLYPGWDGLAAGAESVAGVLDAGEYRRYDWHAGAFLETVRLDPARPLVVEGCGALSSDSLAAARRWSKRLHGSPWSIWLECPEPVRKARALARDGEIFRPHWDRWAAQEEARIAEASPRSLAHEIVHSEQLP